jgi:mono/diheme cytochrome c family protein
LTEIPEHLLKRAKERRAALGGESGAASSDAPAASADAPTPAAAAPAPAAKAPKATPLPTLARDDAPPPPDSPVVAAAKRRRRVPFWAAPVLASLPLWALIYVNAVQAPAGGETDPLVIGAEVYSANCAACHMGDGSGGAAGQQLNEGHTIETFTDPLSMAHWISFGSDSDRDDGTYGDLDRPGGPMNTNTLAGNMAGFANTLSAEELAAVVIYVRSEFGGDLYDPEAESEQDFTAEEFEEHPEDLATLVEEVQGLGEDGIDEVETIERPGS